MNRRRRPDVFLLRQKAEIAHLEELQHSDQDKLKAVAQELRFTQLSQYQEQLDRKRKGWLKDNALIEANKIELAQLQKEIEQLQSEIAASNAALQLAHSEYSLKRDLLHKLAHESCAEQMDLINARFAEDLAQLRLNKEAYFALKDSHAQQVIDARELIWMGEQMLAKADRDLERGLALTSDEAPMILAHHQKYNVDKRSRSRSSSQSPQFSAGPKSDASRSTVMTPLVPSPVIRHPDQYHDSFRAA